MALVPEVTELTSRLGAYTAAEVIDAIRDHINAGDTTHLQIDAYNAGEGLTIGFLDAGESHQVNLRRNTASEIQVSIEPSGSITDPGNSTPTAPSGTSSDWSDEFPLDYTDGSGSFASPAKLWIVELKDAIFLVFTDDANTLQQVIGHWGRVYTPVNSSDAVSAGQDGLGIIQGVPDSINGSSNDWIYDGAPGSTVHWATGEWAEDGVESLDTGFGTNQVLDTADTTYRPLPPVPIIAIDVDGVTNSQGFIGVTKYIRAASTDEPPRTLVADTASNQAWMHVNDINSNVDVVIIWDKTVTP